MDIEIDSHDLVADDSHIYTTAPCKDEQTCWEIVYGDNGKPEGLKLINADLFE